MHIECSHAEWIKIQSLLIGSARHIEIFYCYNSFNCRIELFDNTKLELDGIFNND